MPPIEATAAAVEQYTQQDLQDMLPIYYKRLFPHKNFYRWLSYGEGKRPFNRDFGVPSAP